LTKGMNNEEEIYQLERTLLLRNLQDVFFCRSTAVPFVAPTSESNEEAYGEQELVSLIAHELPEVFPEHFGSRHDEKHSQYAKENDGTNQYPS
jgi:hypothetical protein